jgi:hypothetical protein
VQKLVDMREKLASSRAPFRHDAHCVRASFLHRANASTIVPSTSA